jgi:lipopolysaccharide/colanic/teichoic acid biosynthesis glycosyltransferase
MIIWYKRTILHHTNQYIFLLSCKTMQIVQVELTLNSYLSIFMRYQRITSNNKNINITPLPHDIAEIWLNVAFKHHKLNL